MNVRTLVLNGWAASPHAWDLCAFGRERIYSYAGQLDGLPERALASSAPWLAIEFPELIDAVVSSVG